MIARDEMELELELNEMEMGAQVNSTGCRALKPVDLHFPDQSWYWNWKRGKMQWQRLLTCLSWKGILSPGDQCIHNRGTDSISGSRISWQGLISHWN